MGDFRVKTNHDEGYVVYCLGERLDAREVSVLLNKANGAKPTLSEVLAELESMVFDYVESHNEDNVRQYLRGVLGKYFA